jgi:hypothetical protein
MVSASGSSGMGERRILGWWWVFFLSLFVADERRVSTNRGSDASRLPDAARPRSLRETRKET